MVAESAGLQMVVNARGLISASVDASGSLISEGELTVDKPAGATVREAYLAYATTGFTNTPLAEPLVLAGQEVPLTQRVATGIESYNYFAEVTEAVAPLVDAAPAGEVAVPVTESQTGLTDGEVLVVVFDDPAVTAPRSVTVQYGALSPAGDTYSVHLASPIDLSDPATHLAESPPTRSTCGTDVRKRRRGGWRVGSVTPPLAPAGLGPGLACAVPRSRCEVYSLRRTRIDPTTSTSWNSPDSSVGR